MSAALKEEAKESFKKELTPIIEIFTPVAFFTKTPEVVAEINKRIELVGSVAFEISDSGKKELKKYQASERKQIKEVNDSRKSEYDLITGSTVAKNSEIYEAIKLWTNAIAEKSTSFDEFEAKKLAEIRQKLVSHINYLRREAVSLRDEFIGDSSAVIEANLKLSMITATGSLTAGAKDVLIKHVDSEVTGQRLHDSRILTIENRCLKADIKPPLGKIHLGADFWGSDVIFDATLEKLVTAEIARRVEMEMRIEKQNAAANQKKIDDALKLQKAEAERVALEKVTNEKPVDTHEPEKETPETLRARAKQIDESAARADRSSDADRERETARNIRARADALEKAPVKIPGKKVVTITAKFEISVRDHISIEAVLNHLQSKLPDDLKAALIDCSGY